MLAPVSISIPCSTTCPVMEVRTRSATSSATCSSRTPSHSTTNSSPEMRATVSLGLVADARRRAMDTINWSPTAWPMVSFTCFSLSRSMKRTATFAPVVPARSRASVVLRRNSTLFGSPVSASWVARRSSSARAWRSSVMSLAIVAQWCTVPSLSRTTWTMTVRVRGRPSGERKAISPSQRFVAAAPVSSMNRGSWSRTACMYVRAAMSSATVRVGSTPSRERAVSFANVSDPTLSNTTTASPDTSSRPTNWSDRDDCSTTGVTSTAEPTQPMMRPPSSRAAELIRTHTVEPSGDGTGNSHENDAGSPEWASHARSHSVRTCGTACDHGAVPCTTGPPPRARSRNASFAASSRKSVSVSNTPTGREAVTGSIPPLSQNEYRQWWNERREWSGSTLRDAGRMWSAGPDQRV